MCAVNVGSKSLTLGEHIDAIIHEDYNKPPSDKEREMTSASKLSILGMLLYIEWSINLQLMHCIAPFVFWTCNGDFALDCRLFRGHQVADVQQ
jgi:hypothetical protein